MSNAYMLAVPNLPGSTRTGDAWIHVRMFFKYAFCLGLLFVVYIVFSFKTLVFIKGTKETDLKPHNLKEPLLLNYFNQVHL